MKIIVRVDASDEDFDVDVAIQLMIDDEDAGTNAGVSNE